MVFPLQARSEMCYNAERGLITISGVGGTGMPETRISYAHANRERLLIAPVFH
jgi:hypothetical protein